MEKEFNIVIAELTFQFEIFKDSKNETLLYCKLKENRSIYFFVGPEKNGKWVIHSKSLVPQNILALESELSEKLSETMQLFV